jgi:predicted O-methyltransferase YrrM
MSHFFQPVDSEKYAMDFHQPFRAIEPLEREIAVIDDALEMLVKLAVLPHRHYDGAKLLAHLAAVQQHFEIPWTAISPRVHRLLYAVNAIKQPRVMVAVGVFCGNTFIANAGAAIGPGACYNAQRLVGIEIRPEEADRARRNVASIDTHHRAEIIAADGIPWLRAFDGAIDILYLDANGLNGRGKAIYLDLLEAAEHALVQGSIVLAHNSVDNANGLAEYLAYVRHPAHFRESVNMMVDDQGVEVSLK